jgi:hypothetical protein
MKKYRKKPVVIEAVQLDGTGTNAEEIVTWIGNGKGTARHVKLNKQPAAIYIRTLEGEMRADVGDWIIRGVQGEFYPCKPDIFEATYDAVAGEEVQS